MREKWMRRRMRMWGQQILAECDECADTPESLLARMLEGRRVAFLAPPDVDGTWAEYAVTDVARCVPLGGALGCFLGDLRLCALGH
jgi:hypothetical protein